MRGTPTLRALRARTLASGSASGSHASAGPGCESERHPPIGAGHLDRVPLFGGANPAAPAARNFGYYRGTGEIVPFVIGTFDWGVVVATVSFVLSIVPRHCARLTHFLHPKSRGDTAVLITLKLITPTLRRPAAASAPSCLSSHPAPSLGGHAPVFGTHPAPSSECGARLSGT